MSVPQQFREEIYLPVSVIIPCFQCDKTIQRAVESVTAQTMQPQELILIDDYSNDEGATLTALARVADGCGGIEVKILKSEVNLGPASARNLGWEQSTQPYIAFLDADDSWHPNKLEIQYQWMIENPDVELSSHASISINPDQHLPDLPKKIVAHPIRKIALLFHNYLPTRSVMLKSNITYRFTPEKRYAEDYLLWLKIVFLGGKAFFLDMPMAFAYKHEYGEGGLTSDLWRMQQGVLDTYDQLFSAKLISMPWLFLAKSFSIIKFLRRLVITKWRSIFEVNA